MFLNKVFTKVADGLRKSTETIIQLKKLSVYIYIYILTYNQYLILSIVIQIECSFLDLSLFCLSEGLISCNSNHFTI